MARILWEPQAPERSRLGRFIARIEQEHDISLPDYDTFWQWSIDNLDDFWLRVWQEFDLPSATPPTIALADAGLENARWFPQVQTNYAEAMLRLPGRGDDDVVIVSRSQSRDDREWTAAQLRADVACARQGLLRLGVGEGDRVAAYAPNIGETLILLLASASLGAIFASCAPEFGTQAVTDRLQQIEPKVLLAVDGYQYGTKAISRSAEVREISANLGDQTRVVWLPYLDADSQAPVSAISWDDLLSEPGPLEFAALPFDHPLYILFSSGTTGLPKPIIHGHGGIMVAHALATGLCTDLGPDDRFFWFSTTGWMMWNYLISGLLADSTIIMFDGDPAHEDLLMLWRMCEELQITYFGTSAPYLLQCRKAGIEPGAQLDLSQLRGVGSTGAPLPAEGFHWVYEHVSSAAQLSSVSGGTDTCTAFVGTTPLVPVYEGEISCRLPGVAAFAFDSFGRPVIDQLGELVITKPLPSMPVGFWGDTDGSRYHEAYFADIPGAWRHGDWITITDYGSCVITGRSDATLNRGGVRLGTAEFYTVVESLPEVRDSLVVHLEDPAGGAGELVLFVVLIPGTPPDEAEAHIKSRLREHLSPRHVPDTIHVLSALPRTLSGKKIEVPVKRILQGTAVADAVAPGALDLPEALYQFEAFRTG